MSAQLLIQYLLTHIGSGLEILEFARSTNESEDDEGVWGEGGLGELHGPERLREHCELVAEGTTARHFAVAGFFAI